MITFKRKFNGPRLRPTKDRFHANYHSNRIEVKETGQQLIDRDRLHNFIAQFWVPARLNSFIIL